MSTEATVSARAAVVSSRAKALGTTVARADYVAESDRKGDATAMDTEATVSVKATVVSSCAKALGTTVAGSDHAAKVDIALEQDEWPRLIDSSNEESDKPPTPHTQRRPRRQGQGRAQY